MNRANFVQCQLAAPLTASGVYAEVTVKGGFKPPVNQPGLLVITDVPGNPSAFEVISYTGVGGPNNGVYQINGLSRGLEGTAARAWGRDAYVYQSLTAGDYDAALNAKVDKVAGKQLSSNDFTTVLLNKLNGIASGATVNATDAQLRDRATHTGVQAISTISGLQAALDSKLTPSGNAASATTAATATTATRALELAPSAKAADMANSGWYRSTGAVGWFNETYGGGIYMVDATWVRVYNNKAFYVGNEIVATGNITAYYSDARLKENIRPIEDALGVVLSWNGVRYNANALAASYGYDRDVQQVGLLAQDVGKRAPELVAPAPFDIDGETGGSLSGEHYKTLKYERAVPYLVEAIRVLADRLAKLEDRQ